MSATPYTTVSWNDMEITSTDKLNQMTNNDQWLFENTPRAYYNTTGVARSSGVKILAGIATLAPVATSYTSLQISFGTFFTTGCVPVCTLGLMTYPRFRMSVSFTGIGQVQPDSRGINVRVASTEPISTNQKIDNTVQINYIAIGW